MDFKSWPTTRTVQCWISNQQLGRHTDPIVYAVKDCGLDGRKKTSKRISDESLERVSKRRRTNQSSSEDSCKTIWVTEPVVSSIPSGSEERTSGKRKSEETEEPRKRSKKTSSSSESSENSCKTIWVIEPVVSSIPSGSEERTSGKRKSEETEEPRKRSKKTSSSSESSENSCKTIWVIEPVVSSIPSGSEERTSGKRKSEETEEPRKKSKKTSSSSEASKDHATGVSSRDKPSTSSSTVTAYPGNKAAFEAKYREEQVLGHGGFGAVTAGYRKDDNLPVAIKHINQYFARKTSLVLEGKFLQVPMEVVLLLKIKPAAGETSAAVELLDWYDLDDELVLILERPVPSMTLTDYIVSKESNLSEQEAKIIAKQLVDACIEILSRGVFHRDIKTENILIETGSDVPRVRIIDFGCGTYLKNGLYHGQEGTYLYIPPECFLYSRYRAEPLTVWQLGIVVFGTLHRRLPFNTSSEIMRQIPEFREDLSLDCQNFLQSCLTKSFEARATLKTLKNHPWLL
ncbi:serine/threonine-protein kinase pim-1-like [Chaetodon auriga]|uniref:serine/threonine-protein kinase pim-1-like n=1 Tax=Chaetodon auriga TaxID=39042 RepID=UPI004033079D